MCDYERVGDHVGEAESLIKILDVLIQLLD